MSDDRIAKLEEAVGKLANEIGRLYLSLTFVRTFSEDEIGPLKKRVDEMLAIAAELGKQTGDQ